MGWMGELLGGAAGLAGEAAGPDGELLGGAAGLVGEAAGLDG